MHCRLFLLSCLATAVAASEVKVVITSIAVGAEANYTVSNVLEYRIRVENLTIAIKDKPPRVSVSCLECTAINPILVVVRQNKGVLSWELPFDAFSPNIYDEAPYLSTARTLCPFDIIDGSADGLSDVTLSLSTSSQVPINVSLLVSVETQFILHLGEDHNITENINPATPRFYAYQFPNDTKTESVLLQVNSDSDTCMAVSVQKIHCPVFDLERNVEFDGFWQSVTRSGSITVPRNAFPNGFYAVMVVRGHDVDCSKNFILDQVEDRTKRINIKILPTITRDEFALAVAAALASLVAFAFVFFLTSFFYMKSIRDLYPEIEQLEELPESAIASMRSLVRRSDSQQTNNRTEDGVSIATDSSIDESNIDFLEELERDKHFWRTKSVLYVCDLSRKEPLVLKKKSLMYLWYLLTVSIFYFLPVVQLVITYQKVLYTTGNQNLCFYNFQCAHPFHLLSDFNHVYSNIGYLLLSILFIIIVRRRQNMHLAAVVRNKAVDKCYGIPQHFGLFYAMGASLAVEGVLSGCYHVCPNGHNFQFDTSFMYVISTMCMLKIYHSRHPDVSAGACATFGVLALTILLGMCGVLDGTPAFWSIFTFFHLFTCFLLGVQIYYLGRLPLEHFNCVRLWRELQVRIAARSLRTILPTFPSRFVIIAIANAVNWALAVIGPMYILGNFASYLLMIFMVNLMLYTTFYIIMKLIVKERVTFVPTIFIFLSVVTWSCSLYFFINKAVSWKLSPAESRAKNVPCVLLDFYDNHDIWHFLSAASMFFSFMVLLTLDDDLLSVPRSQIAVF